MAKRMQRAAMTLNTVLEQVLTARVFGTWRNVVETRRAVERLPAVQALWRGIQARRRVATLGQEQQVLLRVDGSARKGSVPLSICVFISPRVCI